MRIAVLGATGYVGGRLITRLLEARHETTLLTRDPETLHDRFPAARVVRGDVQQAPDALVSALEGIDVVYYLVHAADRREADAVGRDLAAARNLAAAAAAVGVRQIIHLGGLGTARRTSSSVEGGRLTVGDELARTGIAVTEFHVSIIIGSGSASFELVRHLTERLPVMIVPRWVATRCQPIGIGDVLDYLVEALEHPEVTGIVEIGGPDVLSFGEMMRTYARVRGLRRLMIPVPVVAPRLSARWLGLVTPVPSWIARPIVDRLRSELVVTDAGPARAFAVRPLGLEEAIRRAVDRTARNEIESTWFDAYSVSHHGRAVPSLELGEGMLVDRRSVLVAAPPDRVFTQVERIGGERGWPFANGLWRIRGLIDRAVGGVGMRLGRRDAERLRIGDALDFWRVEALRRPEVLRLRAEMRLPGRAWLQYEVEEAPAGSRLTQTAFFEPRGLAGFCYWYFLLPVHVAIFRGMVATLAARSVAGSSALSPGGDARSGS